MNADEAYRRVLAHPDGVVRYSSVPERVGIVVQVLIHASIPFQVTGDGDGDLTVALTPEGDIGTRIWRKGVFRGVIETLPFVP